MVELCKRRKYFPVFAPGAAKDLCEDSFVTTFDYDGTKLNKFVQKIAEGGNLGNVNIAQSTKWTQVGVVVKAVNGQTYMAISVAIDTNA